MYACYYFFFKEKRLEQNEYFCANPDLDMARAIWNMLESPMIKKVLGVSLPKIEINKKIWMPKLDNPELFTRENIVNGLPLFTDEARTKA
jgi:hypothetical protein